MADNVPLVANAAISMAADDIGSVWYQRVKVTFGADGVATDASAANPLPVTLSATGPTYADLSGTIAVGGTAQTLSAANAARRVLIVQNTSGNDLRVNDLGAASATAGYLLAPGEALTLADGLAPVTELSIWGGTGAQSFTARQA